MTLPVAIFAFFFGFNGIWLAHKLFWPQRAAYFWLTAGGIVLAIAGLIFAGAAESIARWMWPLTFDPPTAQKFQQQMACDKARPLGIMLIAAPVVVILVPFWLLKIRQQRSWGNLAILVLVLCFASLYASSLPGKLAQSVISEDALKVPGHCARGRQ